MGVFHLQTASGARLHVFSPFFFLSSFYHYINIYKEERISGTDEFLDRRLNLFLFFFEGENSKSEDFFLLVKKEKIPKRL